MDRRERYPDFAETLRTAADNHQTRIWTALPGIINKVVGSAGGKLTVDVQPAINGQYTDAKGRLVSFPLPILQDCPICFPGGGGMTATFPLKAGDECLIVFSSRCIDTWWQSGKVSDPYENRMHDLSDGFVIPGVRSQPNAFALDNANATIISDDGNTYLKLNPTTGAAAVKANGGINLNGVTIDQNGNLHVPGTSDLVGNVTGHATVTGNTDVVSGTISLKNHTHTNGNNGSPTGAPIP